MSYFGNGYAQMLFKACTNCYIVPYNSCIIVLSYFVFIIALSYFVFIIVLAYFDFDKSVFFSSFLDSL